MATVSRTTKIVHYATYGEFYGTAEFVNGSGYLFRCEGEREALLVSYTDIHLQLLDHVETADQRWAEDQGRGGLVHTCSQTTQPQYCDEGDIPDMQRW